MISLSLSLGIIFLAIHGPNVFTGTHTAVALQCVECGVGLKKLTGENSTVIKQTLPCRNYSSFAEMTRRDGCVACGKTSAIIVQRSAKRWDETTSAESRWCEKSQWNIDARDGLGCSSTTMGGGGTSYYCFCDDEDFCNGAITATKSHQLSFFVTFTIAALYVFYK